MKMLNFLNKLTDIEDKQLTNFIVLVFLAIAAFRMLFCGVEINLPFKISWHIQNIDIASVLPMALGLLNLGHFRTVRSQINNKKGNSN